MREREKESETLVGVCDNERTGNWVRLIDSELLR